VARSAGEDDARLGSDGAALIVFDVAARELVLSRIRDVADFPEPGIVFKDITPLLGDPAAFATVVDAFAGFARSAGLGGIDKIVGIEARGFILAAPVAIQLGVGFVPVRKQGKLPGATLTGSYALEYGEATIEVVTDAFAPGDRVLVIDDVLATGGTAAATIELVRRAGAAVAGIAVLLELTILAGRALLAAGGNDVHALITV
jgi:adenine phosphoribosyltransferase